jgi:hypothetical protein
MPRPVVAAAHDDVEAGCPRDAGQRERVAGEAPVGGVDDRLTAGPREEPNLVLGRALVEEPQVVEVAVEVVPDPAEVLERHGLVRETLLAALARLDEHDLEVDEEVLMRQRDAHRVAGDGPEHGLRFSGE